MLPATQESIAALRNAAMTRAPYRTPYPEFFSNFIRGRAVLALAALGDCAWVDLARDAYQDLRMDKSAPAQTLAADLAFTLAYAGHLDGWPTMRAQLLHPQYGSSHFYLHGALLISLIRRQLLPHEEIDSLYAALPYRNRLPARAYLYP